MDDCSFTDEIRQQKSDEILQFTCMETRCIFSAEKSLNKNLNSLY